MYQKTNIFVGVDPIVSIILFGQLIIQGKTQDTLDFEQLPLTED